jgi:hypothetical protein
MNGNYLYLIKMSHAQVLDSSYHELPFSVTSSVQPHYQDQKLISSN